MGRGTTLLESAIMGRVPVGCDINPLSRILLSPRFYPPSVQEVSERLKAIDLSQSGFEAFDDLLAFYHPNTLRGGSLRNYFLHRESSGELDKVDEWIRMVATNRLTGHSAGFFSVYTLPPNQAVSVESQVKINLKRNQTPPDKDLVGII